MKANLAVLLALGLVAGVLAGPALAQDGSGSETATNETTTNESATNETASNETVVVVNESSSNETAPSNETTTEDGEDAGDDGAGPTNPWAQHVRSLKDARKAALDAFKANRSAAVEDFQARMQEIRESYLENKTAVIEACRAEGPGDIANATDEEKEAFAHCVRDGLHPLKDEARAAIAEAKDAFRAEMKDARTAALGAWKDQLREAREKFQAEKREQARQMGKGSGPGKNPHADRAPSSDGDA